MELWKKQKKIAVAFGIFLCFMYLCTLISQAVYASKLPQVTTEKPGRGAITHEVQAEGIVRQGMEYAVNTLSGLRCRTVHAHVGDRVTTETLLFEVDTEDLQEQIQEQELTIQKLQLTIKAQEQNRNLDASERRTKQERAQEDYDNTSSTAQDTVDRAKDSLASQEAALEDLRNNPVSITSEEDRQKAQAAYEEWAAKEEALKAGIDNAQTDEEKKAAQAAYDDYKANPVAEPDFSGEDEAQAAWEEQKRALKEGIESAEQTLSDARKTRDQAVLEAKRNLADAQLPGMADNTLEINRMELKVLQEKLTKYRELQESGGLIYPESEGIVTGIHVSPGERIPDGAAVVYADTGSPLQFCFSLTKAQKKYVNQGDQGELTLNGSRHKVTVDYVAENEMNPEIYDVTIFLPEDVGTIGQSGFYETKTQSEIFDYCIPIDALYTDPNGRNFVYVLSERSGILGVELVAEQVYVKTLDKNESTVALEGGVIDSDSELIVSSTESLEDGDVVRYKE
ncbi:MAG: hypothetical protein HFJ10_03065 [Lachnospiraceae bacterium]|jgi:multidrug efflux pump subunit AcrA (membrane-fusion protein)|nr:hypothetical protein [Lachnospiraceae bacterium]